MLGSLAGIVVVSAVIDMYGFDKVQQGNVRANPSSHFHGNRSLATSASSGF